MQRQAKMRTTLLRGFAVSNSEPTESRESDDDVGNRKEAASPSGRRIINAQALLGDEQEVLIQNGEEFYRLRRTRAGKLILYK